MTKSENKKLTKKYDTPDVKRFENFHKGRIDLLPLPEIKSVKK